MTKNTALVLSSGGARGIAHIGVIEELMKAGFKITSVAGTSMGSVIGGVYAADRLAEFKEWLLHITKMDVVKLLDFTIGKGGLVKGEKIIAAMEHFIRDVKIEELQIPYAAVSADLKNHREVVFTSGDLLHAIRASISIPTVFNPVLSDHSLLVDGGVLNPLPIDVVKRLPGDLLIAVNVNASIPYNKPESIEISTEHESIYRAMFEKLNHRWSNLIQSNKLLNNKEKKDKEQQPGLFEIITDSLNLVQDKLSQVSIEKYNPDLVVNISYKSANAFEFYKSEELIEAGRIACQEALAENPLLKVDVNLQKNRIERIK
jgi:NTE family protein